MENDFKSITRYLGEPTTVGELKKLIENYPDNTLFGFRHQVFQQLVEVKFPDTLCVVFADVKNYKQRNGRDNS
jgi:hypothetical protein